MRRLVIGVRMVRVSARVALRMPVLIVPGVLQALAVVAVIALAYGALAPSSGGSVSWSTRSVAVLAAALFTTTAIGTWSGAVVVALTADRLRGGDAGLRYGVAQANRHLPALLGWSLVSASVGGVLRLVEERLGPVGRALTGAAGMLFAAGTVLVVPVLVLEGARPLQALRRSASLFRQRFGETAGGELGLQAATGAALVAAIVLLACPAAVVSLPLGLAVGALLLVAYLAVTAVLHAVLSTVLHRYVTGLPVEGHFGDLAALFPPRRTRPAPVPSYPGPHGTWDAS